MGDQRYLRPYEKFARSKDRAATLAQMADDEVIMALAAASQERDALTSNVLATEAMNRMHRSRTIAEHIAEGAFALDADGRFVFVNPSLARMLGEDWRAFIGQPVARAMRLDGGAPDPLGEALERACIVEWSGTCVPCRAAPFYAALTVAPIVREGVAEGVVATLRDTTEERRLLVRYEAMFRQQPNPAFFLDRGGRILDLNPAAERILGSPAARALGRDMGSFLPDPAERSRAYDNFASVLSGASRSDEYEVARDDGTRARVRVTGIPMRDGREIVGMYGLAEVRQEPRGGKREPNRS